MKTCTLSVLAAVLMAFAFPGDPDGLQPGAKATLTDVALTNIDGNQLTLDSQKDQNGLLVVFSCNTCPFVVGSEQFPGWERQYNELHDLARKSGVGMVLINSNEAKRPGDDTIEAMKEHAKKQGYTMPYLVDTDSKLANAYGARTTPHVYLFDSDLKLIYTGSIDNSWDTKRIADEAYLKNALNEIAAGKNISINNTQPRGCSIKRKK